MKRAPNFLISTAHVRLWNETTTRKSLAAGILAFNNARATNLEILRSVTLEQWNRTGSQEGVGKVSLCDIPVMMAEHDAAHRHEIEAWLGQFSDS